MTEAFAFMGNHPWLTFFLALIAGNTIVYGIKAITGHRNCNCESEDDDA